ncbi:MAG: hypothetical protein JWO78_1188 [Micavibrio sp.]|nr:hypothetical protein [Micavibrio sp.]
MSAFLSRLALAAFIALSCSASLAHAEPAGQWQLGAEGFYDNYKEPDPNVRLDNDALYGSLTAGYTATGHSSYNAFDARLSLGRSDYSSVSGTSENAAQVEAEFRLRTGFHFDYAGGSVNPYLGLGARLYYDHSQNIVTSLGYVGYDRQIAQFYIPVGIDMAFPAGAWTIKPTIEYDQLFYGKVNSKLSQAGGNYSDISNTQHDGYGLRGSIMFGHEWMGYQWEIGPFARYWNIDESSINTDRIGRRWVEPDNERLQAGIAVKVAF